MRARMLLSLPILAGITLALAACDSSVPPAASSSEATSVASVADAAPPASAAVVADATSAAPVTPATSTDAAPVPDLAASEIAMATPSDSGSAPTLAADASTAPDNSGAVSAVAQAGGPQASAQPAALGQQAPAQNWLKICDPIKDGQRACIMRQVVVTQNKQFLGSFLLRDDPGQQSRLLAVAAVPLGVLLPFGVTWQIDNSKPIRVPYMLCDPQSCATQIVINEAYLASLRKGTKLVLTAKNRKNEDLIVTINLQGFTTVYDGDAALTFDEFNKNVSGEGALEKILADRAESARNQLESSSSAPQ